MSDVFMAHVLGGGGVWGGWEAKGLEGNSSSRFYVFNLKIIHKNTYFH